jgi:hypothetical protein
VSWDAADAVHAKEEQGEEGEPEIRSQLRRARMNRVNARVQQSLIEKRGREQEEHEQQQAREQAECEWGVKLHEWIQNNKVTKSNKQDCPIYAFLTYNKIMNASAYFVPRVVRGPRLDYDPTSTKLGDDDACCAPAFPLFPSLEERCISVGIHPYHPSFSPSLAERQQISKFRLESL